MKKTQIEKILQRHQRENNVNSEHRIVIAEKDFNQLSDDLLNSIRLKEIDKYSKPKTKMKARYKLTVTKEFEDNIIIEQKDRNFTPFELLGILEVEKQRIIRKLEQNNKV